MNRAQSHHSTNRLTAMTADRPPPKLRPFMIILMVLSVGAIFIGLTMTIIAHWPGYSPYGGNPLAIAGPVVLCLGAVVLIGGIVNVCYNTNQENKENMKSYPPSRAVSRGTLVSQSSYYAGSVPSMTQRQDFRPDLNSSGNSAKYPPTNVDMNPNAQRNSMTGYGVAQPSGQPMTGYGAAPPSGQPMTGYGAAPPSGQPMTGYGAAPPSGQPRYSNVGYPSVQGDRPVAESSPPEKQAPAQPRRQMEQYSTSGYDMHDGRGYNTTPQQPQMRREDTSFDDDNPRHSSSIILETPPGHQQQHPQYRDPERYGEPQPNVVYTQRTVTTNAGPGQGATYTTRQVTSVQKTEAEHTAV